MHGLRRRHAVTLKRVRAKLGFKFKQLLEADEIPKLFFVIKSLELLKKSLQPYIVSYHPMLYRTALYRVISYGCIIYRIVSYLTVSYHTASHCIVSYHIISYLTVLYNVLLYHTVSYCIVLCLAVNIWSHFICIFFKTLQTEKETRLVTFCLRFQL